MALIDSRRSRWLAALTVAAIVAATAIVFLFGLVRDRTGGRSTSQARSTLNPPNHGRSRSTPVQARAPGWAWPLETAMEKIDGARITAAGRILRIDSTTTLCSGVGTRVVRAGVARWYSFDCTFTAFQHGIDQDVEFRVTLIGANRFAISRAHRVGEQR
jgi:hypothetical protein